ncbi:OmpH family outer membrane protein [Fodinibius sediminis]|uniref:Periplasmic chaperone for outer membrane proteins Skp n=1 Tax=Fodinibius sediminis TaxID=1214077 RepID=A0A521E0S0_9BACT|nr:OmpH family outer membrane protein [Fodinibius sediminis]SMO77425.1 periplasmic chaperone for outer membrane proteins Skp [Fodinibius sediminis]
MLKSAACISLVAVCFLFGWIAEAGAQQQKIGYVDTDYLLSHMSEYESVQQQLRSLSSEWNSELQEMEEEIEKLREDFQSKKVLYTEQQQQQKREQIQSKVARRQQYLEERFGSDGQYFQRQKELLEPIQRTIFEAVDRVAERGGFDFVFDRAQNSGLLFGNKEFNLNEEVLQELGVTLNESSN